MAGAAKDPLRELLRRELDSFAAQAAQAEEGLGTSRIEAIAALARLIETRDALQPKPRNWWPPAVLLGTLTVASVLLFARVRETEIEIDASLSQASFSLVNAQVVTGAANVSEVGVSGLQEVVIPQGNGPAVSMPATGLSIEAAASASGASSLTVSPLVLPAGAEVTASWLDAANHYRLATNARSVAVQAAAQGAMTLHMPGASARMIRYATPEAIVMRGGSDDLSIDLSLSPPSRFAFSPQLHVKELAVGRIDQFLQPGRSLVKHISTILSGTVTFETLNGEAFPLRPGEDLQFERSDGEIRSLEFMADHLQLKYYGRVRGMAAGTGEGHRSIMPTYLEWLKARHGLSLLWGSSLYLFGLAAGALRWFGVRI